MTRGLFLSGGGARGAYQAGVLLAMAEHLGGEHEHPFEYISGVSAGAINATYLAANYQNWCQAAIELSQVWSELHANMVYRSDLPSLGRLSYTWIRDLLVGGSKIVSRGDGLLDTEPLAKLLKDLIDLQKLHANVANRLLHGVEVSATDYMAIANVAFYDKLDEEEIISRRVGRRYAKTSLTLEHVLASTAIPLFFPPVLVDGTPFGDGCLRNNTPLSPLIKMGAEKILVIGVKKRVAKTKDSRTGRATVGRVLSVVLNSIFLEALDQDIERVNRFNDIVSAMHGEQQEKYKIKNVEVFCVTPSVDLGELAAECYEFLPTLVKYMLKGIGDNTQNSEILSYLLFEPGYCERLVEIGYADAKAQMEEIRAFLYGSAETGKRSLAGAYPSKKAKAVVGGKKTRSAS